MISFIIPTLNEEKVLTKLLNNLREISGFKFEIIVSDGGSTDKTVEMAKKIADKTVENLTGHRQTIGQGRNAGAAAAAGDYLVFLDADVFVPEPDIFFQRAMENFKKNPQLKELSCWLRVFPESETLGDRIGYGILTNWMLVLNNNIFHSGAGCGEFGMMRRQDFEKLGGYREDLAADEDQDLARRFAKIGRTFTDKKLLIYHTGRRPHQIGWPRLLWQWTTNWLALVIFNRSAAKEWKVIR